MSSVPVLLRRGVPLFLAAMIGLTCGGGGQTATAGSPSAGLKFSSREAASQPAGSTKVVMKDMQYSPKSISVPSGKVVLYLVNAEAVPCGWPDCRHDIVITTLDKRAIAYSDNIEAGKATVLTIEAMSKGQYLFHDDIGKHFVELNMSGSLDVS